MAGELGEMGGGSVAESLVPHVQLEPEKRIAEENVARSMMADTAPIGCDGRDDCVGRAEGQAIDID